MNHQKSSSLRSELYEIIFGHETLKGKIFDVVLIASILISVVAVMLDSVSSISLKFGALLLGLEWFFTGLFTLEYLLRLYSSPKPKGYALSFFGIIDLLAIIPTYLSIFIPGGRFLIIVRVLRVLRIFRILKMVQFIDEAHLLRRAIRASRHKIIVFLLTVLCLVLIVGSIMYLVEGPEAGFTSIPKSLYWAIVTVTTVGYGDIAPVTPFGQALAALLMITGYGIIAVPTGIVTIELGRESLASNGRECPNCDTGGHDRDAHFCKYCGAALEANGPGQRSIPRVRK